MENALAGIAAERLAGGVAEIFVAVGLPTEAARIVADDLVAADLEGIASHGVMLVPMYLDRLKAGSVSLASEGEMVSDRAGAVVLDGLNALGQLTAHQAVGLALERARRHGLAAVSVRNAFHFGAAGRYARMLADGGAAGIVASNTRPLMPAPGGAEPLVGNNPLAIAVPAGDGRPAVKVDLALSAGAMGKVRLAQAAGQLIPEGWAVDRDGAPTTDPATAIGGMLLPAAGPKGFGLAFLLDLLCGGLSGGGVGSAVRPLYGDPSQPYNCSHLFLAIDIGHFREPDDFAENVREAADAVSGSRRAPGVERVYAPGQLSQARRELAGGTCRLSSATTASLKKAAAELGLDADRLF